jgi:hypothetical protein
LERAEPVCQPNTARSMRMNQRSPMSRGSPPSGTGTGRLRGSGGVSGISLLFGASLSAIMRKAQTSASRAA